VGKAKAISQTVFTFMRRNQWSKMPYCPECGGEMQYMIATKHYVCKSCGLSVTQQELMELREKLRPNLETEEEERQKQKKEYLKWYLSKKK
jgi:tRNA(Ile2) C34 agmatinyltransferase TiaS